MKKIFVADCASLGDTLLATPTLRAIKETWPDSRTIMMASPAARDILDGHPYVDDLLLYKKGDSIFPVIKKIWRSDYALILDYHYRSSLFAWLARIPVRIGRGSKKNSWLTRQLFNSAIKPIYEAEKTLEVARAIGFSTCDLSLSIAPWREKEKSHVHGLLREQGINPQKDHFIVIAPYSLSPLKDWPEEYYGETIRYLKEKQYSVILVGGKENREKAKHLLPNCINLVGLTNIRETTYLISLARLVICGCTSVLHFASTTNTPQIAIYGPTLPEQWAPRQNCTVVYHRMPCSPCYNTGRSCSLDKKCIRVIKPDEVIEKISRILVIS